MKPRPKAITSGQVLSDLGVGQVDKKSALNLDMSNLTGGQIQEVLDFLILNSLKPIIEASDVFNVQIAYLLACTSQNRKRKLSALPREEFMSLMARALVTQDRLLRFDLISIAKIERSFLYNFVVKFLKYSSDYLSVYEAYLRARTAFDRDRLDKKLKILENSLTLSRDRLLPAIHTARDYLDMAYTFRNSIVENYIKMANKQARAFVKMKGDNFDLNDVRQNFLTAVTKAIDKYDSSKGAITSYINWWVLNAQAGSQDHDHEYGIAFTIPQLQRKKLAMGSKGDVNFSVSLEGLMRSSSDQEFGVIDTIQGDVGMEQSRVDDEDMQLTRQLIKECDPSSLARLYLDIEETFNRSEFAQMISIMESQGLRPPEDIKNRIFSLKTQKQTSLQRLFLRGPVARPKL